MKRQAKELLNKINALRNEALADVEAGKLDDAETKQATLKEMQRQFNLMNELDSSEIEIVEESGQEHETEETEPKAFTKKEVISAFVHTFTASISKGKINAITARDKEVVAAYAAMSGGTPEDGGLTVPQDIQTDIKELRRTQDNLEQHVNVEIVNTKTGSRVIEKEADTTPWDDVDESGEFTEDSTPQFIDVKYEIKKRGGILKVTYELLKDSAANIMMYLNKYIAKKSRATRNFHILKKVDEITEGKAVAVKDLDGFKDIFNVLLEPAIAATSIIITNQTGFNFLDKLKDSDGNYILQKDATTPTIKRLFGTYLIVPMSDKVVKMNGKKAPFICGDLKEAITLFDRERITIDINENVYWVKDKTGIKIRDRFDVQAVDATAVIKAEIDTTAPLKA